MKSKRVGVRRAVGTAALAFLAALLFGAAPVRAEMAWVKDELRLNVRTGPGVQYRIVGVLETGDRVEILTRAEGWTQVRPNDSLEGWIPVGYLQSEPPATVTLARIETETAELEERLAALAKSESELREANAEIRSRDEKQQAEIGRLVRENLELRAGARWPEWLTGAGIVTFGMALGAILGRTSGRRRRQRIKL